MTIILIWLISHRKKGCCGSVVVDFLFIVTPIVGVCNCCMFCCTLLYVHSSVAIILMGKRELIALLDLSSWCLMMVERLFLLVPRGSLQFVIVVYTHLLFLCHTKLNSFDICRLTYSFVLFLWEQSINLFLIVLDGF